MVVHFDTATITEGRMAVARRRRRAAAKPQLRSRIERAAEADEGRLKTKALYLAAAVAAGEAEAAELQLEAWRIAALLRRVCEGGGGALAAAGAADRWLTRRFKRCDDDLRRSLAASLALVSAPEGLPEAMTALHPAAHLRLASFLNGPAPYDPDFFAKDLAFGCGFFTPIGPLSLGVPTSKAPDARLTHARKAAGLMVRMAKTDGVRAAADLARAVGVRPWAELHVDTRTLRDFNPEGFERAYQRLAALMRLRPDLAGAHGASWLYDPVLTEISPSLDFVTEPMRAGGASLVRLGIDPVQTAYAVSRSPTRRRLWLDGLYKPACYGMYWPREKLIAWSEARGGA